MHYIQGKLICRKDIEEWGIQQQQIKKYIEDIIDKINVELITACKNGKYKIVIKIPTDFEILYLTKENAKTYIISKLIKYIQENEYSIYINPKEEHCEFEISWSSITNHYIKNYCNSLIRNHTKEINQ